MQMTVTDRTPAVWEQAAVLGHPPVCDWSGHPHGCNCGSYELPESWDREPETQEEFAA